MKSILLALVILFAALHSQAAPSLGQALHYLYPQAVRGDWMAGKDSSGVEAIQYWNAAKLGQQPSAQQISDAKAAITAAAATNATKAATDAADIVDIMGKLKTKIDGGTASLAEKGTFRIMKQLWKPDGTPRQGGR